MNGKIAAVLVSSLLLACVPPQPPPAPPPAPPVATPPAAPPPAAVAPANRWVSIRSVRCQRLLELSEDDRAAASMFYIGYQAARARVRSVNVGAIPSTEAQALAYCQQFPNRSVLAAFTRAYWRTQR